MAFWRQGVHRRDGMRMHLWAPSNAEERGVGRSGSISICFLLLLFCLEVFAVPFPNVPRPVFPIVFLERQFMLALFKFMPFILSKQMRLDQIFAHNSELKFF